jgi:hypothetical protein
MNTLDIQDIEALALNTDAELKIDTAKELAKLISKLLGDNNNLPDMLMQNVADGLLLGHHVYSKDFERGLKALNDMPLEETIKECPKFILDLFYKGGK